MHKAYGDSFEATGLEDRSAWGAPPPDQVIAHTNLYWRYETAPGRTGGTVSADEVQFAQRTTA